MDIPFVCSCNHTNMVDILNMERRPLSKLMTEEGYTCEACGAWEAVFRTTPSLDDAMKKLLHRPTPYRFEKVLRKADAIQERRWRVQA